VSVATANSTIPKLSREKLDNALAIEGEAGASYLDEQRDAARDWWDVDAETKIAHRRGDNGTQLWKGVPPLRLLEEGVAGWLYARDSLARRARTFWGGTRNDQKEKYRVKARQVLAGVDVPKCDLE
jgi:hypothetical protein